MYLTSLNLVITLLFSYIDNIVRREGGICIYFLGEL